MQVPDLPEKPLVRIERRREPEVRVIRFNLRPPIPAPEQARVPFREGHRCDQAGFREATPHLLQGKEACSRDEWLMHAQHQALGIEPEVEAHHTAQVADR